MAVAATTLMQGVPWQHPAASAVFHESPRILLAAVKFFLGQDEAGEGGDSDDEGEDGGAAPRAVNPTKAEMYSASKKVWAVACPHASSWHWRSLRNTSIEKQLMEMATLCEPVKSRAAVMQEATSHSDEVSVSKT